MAGEKVGGLELVLCIGETRGSIPSTKQTSCLLVEGEMEGQRGVEMQGGDPNWEGELEEAGRGRTHLSVQVIHVAHSTAFFVEGKEVA